MKYIKEYNEYIDGDDDIEQWMSGECIAFAVALNQVFPEYKIAVLNDVFEDVDEDSEYNYNFVHAFSYLPNNHRIIIDARGVRKLKDLYEEFHDINPEIDWDIPDSEYLINNFADKEFYTEESYKCDISDIEEAKEFILRNKTDYEIS